MYMFVYPLSFHSGNREASPSEADATKHIFFVPLLSYVAVGATLIAAPFPP